MTIADEAVVVEKLFIKEGKEYLHIDEKVKAKAINKVESYIKKLEKIKKSSKIKFKEIGKKYEFKESEPPEPAKPTNPLDLFASAIFDIAKKR